MDIRKPVVAGQFYPDDKTELERQVRNFLLAKGREIKKENAKAAVVPHAGYNFSGKLAGKVFSIIPHKKDFILLGVNHSGIGAKACLSIEDFETPLGIVKNNRALGEKILAKLKKEKIDAEINEQAHALEHSLEVQLPFLQASQNKFEIVPIILNGLEYEECIKTAKVLSEFGSENVFVLASSDFTHYGPAYGFVPFYQPEKNLKKYDVEIIMEILKNDSKGFYDMAKKSTVCGIYAIAVLSEIAKIKKFKAKLVDYYTSGDVLKEWSNAVGYAGIVFE